MGGMNHPVSPDIHDFFPIVLTGLRRNSLSEL
jgi:hypothetical protein